jgi:hypothetical protein
MCGSRLFSVVQMPKIEKLYICFVFLLRNQIYDDQTLTSECYSSYKMLAVIYCDTDREYK